jgi:hypothetical protein
VAIITHYPKLKKDWSKRATKNAKAQGGVNYLLLEIPTAFQSSHIPSVSLLELLTEHQTKF